jgi:hypothetical protein
VLCLALYPIWCWCRYPEIGTSSIDWTQLSRFYLKTETESSLRNVFLNENSTVDDVQKHTGFMSLSSFPSIKVLNPCFPCGVEVKNAWSFTYMLTVHIHAVVRKYRDQFLLLPSWPGSPTKLDTSLLPRAVYVCDLAILRSYVGV